MATQQQGSARQAGPVTSHPLFPAVVALWFGALFGIGSLAMRGALIEELVIASRIDLLVSAAAPPLGLTARLLLALGLAAFGAMIGAWLGRKLGEAPPAKNERRRDAATLQPRSTHGEVQALPALNVAESELAEATDPVLPGRRQALVVDSADLAIETSEPAPVPVGAPEIFAVAETGIAPIEAASLAPEAAEPLELAARAPALVPPAPIEPVTETVATTEHQVSRSTPAPIDPDAPLPDLAARLAAAMERRREARVASVPPPLVQRADADPVADLVLPSLLPPRELIVPPHASFAAVADHADEVEGEGDDISADDRFSSLLALAPRLEAQRGPFIRTGEPTASGAIEPVVVFPSQLAGPAPAQPAAIRSAPLADGAQPDQDETERSLRQALANLQRMSGAA